MSFTFYEVHFSELNKTLMNLIVITVYSKDFLYARLETGRIMWLGMAGWRPHNNFSSVYQIFTKLGHMIPLWKGKNPIYFGVITIIPFDNLYRRAYFVMHTFLVYYYYLIIIKKTFCELLIVCLVIIWQQ